MFFTGPGFFANFKHPTISEYAEAEMIKRFSGVKIERWRLPNGDIISREVNTDAAAIMEDERKLLQYKKEDVSDNPDSVVNLMYQKVVFTYQGPSRNPEDPRFPSKVAKSGWSF